MENLVQDAEARQRGAHDAAVEAQVEKLMPSGVPVVKATPVARLCYAVAVAALLSQVPQVGPRFTSSHAQFLARPHATCGGTGVIRMSVNVPVPGGRMRQEPKVYFCRCVDKRLRKLGLKDGVDSLIKLGDRLFFPKDFGHSRLIARAGEAADA